MTTREPLPCLQDMPKHVKAAIIADFSFRERFPLRLLSSEFSSLADSLKMREKLEMYIHPNRIWFGMGFRLFQYEDSESGCLRNGQLLHGVRFEDAVLAHLNSYTSKPKLTFEKLKINTPSQNSYNYSRFLNKFQQKYANTPLKVEYLKLRGPHCKEKEFIDFVAYMDSEVLKSLEFLPSGSVRYQGIVEMVQWRNLKLFCTRASFLSQLPFESYAHIPEFSIDLSGDLDDEWMVRLIKHWLPCSTFQSALLSRGAGMAWISDAMRQERQWQIIVHGSNHLFIDWQNQKCLGLTTIGGSLAKVRHWTMDETKAFMRR